MNKLKKDTQSIFYAGIDAVNPLTAIKRHVLIEGSALSIGTYSLDLDAFDSIYVCGAGKASASMAKALEELLGDRITNGTIIVKYNHRAPLSRIKLLEASHPVPDISGYAGALALVQDLHECTEKTLVLFVLSGGGSSLLPLPVSDITLHQKQEVTSLLLKSGASITEMNTIRKHLSQIKGGRLSRIAFPATVITLILSDVVGDPLDSIASGPTVADSSTFDDCLAILEKYRLTTLIPRQVLRYLKEGARGDKEETVKPGDPVLEKTFNCIIGNNSQFLESAKEKAEELGYVSFIETAQLEGQTHEAALAHCKRIDGILTSTTSKKPVCLLYGGETTLKIDGTGKGGRNQEYALVAARECRGMRGIGILSAGTDGTDGSTDAAGAFCDGTTVERGRKKGLDVDLYLENNDSYHYFMELGDLFITGPTGTNVMDSIIILIT